MKAKVITGIGVVSSIGLQLDDYYNYLINEKVYDLGLNYEQDNATNHILPVNFSKEYKTEQYFEVPLVGHYGLYAVQQAIKQAQIIPEEIADRMGLILATTFGSMDIDLEVRKNIENKTPKLVHPLNVLVSGKDFVANYCSLNSKVKAFCHTVTGQKCAGLQAISLACEALEQEKADVVLVGAADVLPKLLEEAFNNPEYAHLDIGNIGQGAAFFVLETLENAKKRKANILVQLDDIQIGSQVKIQVADKEYTPHAASSLENMVGQLIQKLEDKNNILICPSIQNEAKEPFNELDQIASAFTQDKKELSFVLIKKYLGECYSVSNFYQIITAIGLINEQLRSKHSYKGKPFDKALITACEENGCIGALMLEKHNNL